MKIENIELIEAVLVKIIVKIKKIKEIKKWIGAKTMYVPNVHETPFPPLNFKNGLVACPIIERIPVIEAIKKSKYFNAKNVGIKDFNISKIPVTIPSFLSNLKTLVAPILPLPNFLISFPFNLTIK